MLMSSMLFCSRIHCKRGRGLFFVIFVQDYGCVCMVCVKIPVDLMYVLNCTCVDLVGGLSKWHSNGTLVLLCLKVDACRLFVLCTTILVVFVEVR